MRLNSFTWFSGAAILLLGCQTQVVGGGGGGGGAGGTDTSASTSTSTPPVDTVSSTGTSAPPPPVDDGPAIAMLRSELPPPSAGEGSSGVTTTGGSAEDPNALFLFISNAAQSCANPFAGAPGCATPTYQVSIVLPPALQAVGTYPLDQLGFASDSEPAGSGVCSGGGGSYWDGTIAITAIDPTQVTFTLAGTAPILGVGGTADGSYTAKRCF